MTLFSTDDYSIIGVGFCHVDCPLSGMPGWISGSWGYHGDDGKKYCQNWQGTDYGPTYGAEDVVGCGVNFTTNSAFFTKNGQYLGKQRSLTPAGDAANILL
jgi:Ran-binding protein 9/10